MVDSINVIDGLGVSKLAPLSSGANPDFLVVKMDTSLASNIALADKMKIPAVPLVVMDFDLFDQLQDAYTNMAAYTWERNPITKSLFNSINTGVLNNKKFSAILLRLTDDGCFISRNKQYATQTWVIGLTNATKLLLESKFKCPVIVDISDDVMRKRCGNIYSYLEKWLVCQRGTEWIPSKIMVMNHAEGGIEYGSKLIPDVFYNVLKFVKTENPPENTDDAVIPRIGDNKMLSYLWLALVDFAKKILAYKP